MKYIPEEESRLLISHEIAYNAVKESFIAAAVDETSSIFPAVAAHAARSNNIFTIKSGTTSSLSGLKVGSYWPDNTRKGEPNHNSTILLMDQTNGRISTVIEAGEVNAYRTAAADAVAASILAVPGSSTLAIYGAGHQALYECLALARVLPIKQVYVVARDTIKAQKFAYELHKHDINAIVADSAKQACMDADIVVTATPSETPLFNADWIKPGTHISCMGADAQGKQEIPPELFSRARLFCDSPAQSRRIGEFQHCKVSKEIYAIGHVLQRTVAGRQSKDQITVFDSSGIALQDLFIAEHLARAWESKAACQVITT